MMKRIVSIAARNEFRSVIKDAKRGNWMKDDIYQAASGSASQPAQSARREGMKSNKIHQLISILFKLLE